MKTAVDQSDPSILALQAIDKGLTIGQFLRSLPNYKLMTIAQLEVFSKAYAEIRSANPAA